VQPAQSAESVTTMHRRAFRISAPPVSFLKNLILSNSHNAEMLMNKYPDVKIEARLASARAGDA
jgi:hypothetical protein